MKIEKKRDESREAKLERLKAHDASLKIAISKHQIAELRIRRARDDVRTRIEKLQNQV